MKQIYLDYNATTPIDRRVADAMRPYLDEYFGNPSSAHRYGVKTKLAVEKARQQVAGLLHCEPSEIVFTSGGTESNNFAIKGVAFAHKDKGNHIITSTVEHPAVFEVCHYLEKNGFDVTYVPVDEFGIVKPDELEAAIRPETILITVMHANNEVGSIQPIPEISRIAKKHGIIFHSDAAQSVGKIPVDVQKMGVDLLSVAGHKLYAPKGIGVLYIRSGTRIEKLIHGADHEQNLRAGTENVLEIVGLGKAAEIAKEDLKKNREHYQKTRDYLFKLLKEAIPELRLNGHPEKRLPNTLSVSFPKTEANALIARMKGVAASAGAACHAESVDVSTVLEVMMIPLDFAMGTLRFSTGRSTSMRNIEKAAEEIIAVAGELMAKNKETELNEATTMNEINMKDVKLTQYAHGMGCACKIQPEKLEAVLKKLNPLISPNLMVGTETSDDAMVYKLRDDLAIVQSLDFFAPIVDDPYDFGAIAAANALSDIYAMGATPLFALNIVGFPEGTLPLTVLEAILKGAEDKAAEAGIGIHGGHSIDDPEPKYGMVVTGSIHPDRILKNKDAQTGDVLILTKPLGTGILSTALKKGLIGEDLRKELTKNMTTLNKVPSEKMLKYEVHACTDVTGFGLLGHLREMSTGSGCDVQIYYDKVPFMQEVKNLAAAGVIPGGTRKNSNFVKQDVDYGSRSEMEQLLLNDAQTSGGLLVAMKASDAGSYLSDLHAGGFETAAVIGEFTGKGSGKITVR